MIKCEVDVCAKITRAASVKETSDGKTFLSFGVQVPVVGRNNEKAMMEIGISVDGDKSQKSIYSEGRRVKVSGTLTIRKKDDKVYYNLRAAEGGVDTCKSTESDNIEGTMFFRGKINKRGVEVRKDKKENDYKCFSAFSVDKDGDKSQFTYVRFIYFHCKEGEDFLQAGSYVEVNGQLQLGVFRDEVSFDCRVDDVCPWEKPQKD